MEITTLLKNLDEVLKSKNPQLYKILASPLTDKKLSEASEKLDFPLPENIQYLYKWKNGTLEYGNQKLGLGWMFPLSIFNPIDKVVRDYLNYNHVNAAFGEEIFTKNIIPLFESGGDEQTFIDIDPESISYGKLFFFTHHEPELDFLSSYADSLESLISSIIECYEKGIFYFDERNQTLGYDPVASYAVFLNHNPNAEYWQFYHSNNITV